MLDSDDRVPTDARDRGQSTMLGFLFVVLLVLIVLSLNQAVVVPQHNAEVEFQHARTMEDRIRAFQSRLYLVGATGGTQSLTTDLGVDYPPRTLAINPAPPAGRLHTRTVGNVSVSVNGSAVDLSAACGYGGPNVTSRSVAIDAQYNEYSRDPSFVHSHSALYQRTESGYVLLSEEQSLISNDTVVLRPITSNYSRSTAGSVTLELVGGPHNQTTVSAGSGETVNVSFPSGLPASEWRTLLQNESLVTSVDSTASERIRITLEAGNDYTIDCAAIGLNRVPPSE